MSSNFQTIWWKTKIRYHERLRHLNDEKSNQFPTLRVHGYAWSQLKLNGVLTHTYLLKH